MNSKRTKRGEEEEFFRPSDEIEEAEARKLQEIAERAEKKALERLLSKSSEKKEATFLSKVEREQLALRRLEEKRKEKEDQRKAIENAHSRFVSGKTQEERLVEERNRREKEIQERERRQREENKEAKELDFETKAIRDHYLGINEKKRKILKPSEKFSRIFQFEWEADDDTSKSDANPLYCNRLKIHTLFGRGYLAGVDQREQRKGSNFLLSLGEKRLAELKKAEEEDEGLTEKDRLERASARGKVAAALKQMQSSDGQTSMDKLGSHWSEKRLSEMTERDWRIFREDFDIRIEGGRATLPLRFWEEAQFPISVLNAIRDAGYEKPSPIQRQAIPIGMSRRDIIGIAETGSGKTAAFIIPMLSILLQSPPEHLSRCAHEGPLAVIMAPTRELAQQIDEECSKLAKYTDFISACVVGGQSIEEQGFKLRKGVHIVIGTPGRICDCLENNYLVLNQCNYVVLDEADRMVDMGFEAQVIAVLDAMGGLLKSEDEEQAELQLANKMQQLYRVTAMFSATMPVEVERIAKSYLRHPAIIKIGDEDSGKNKRIEQRVVFISEGQKKNKLAEEIRRLSNSDKVIVFVNAKKQGDVIGRYLDSLNIHSGVLHGGRSQDQREETLESFRKGEIQVLVATDVAGRGLDIPDVSHVYNLDCPSKIDSYCHRIGRTGRAGKHGIATTFLTDADTEIMYELKNYLEATDAVIPIQLARHPAAQAPVGTRDDKGKVMGQKRDAVKFLN